ncbi:alpha/beta hydrolase [Bacillus cereus group sp. TH43LC]|uniref:alpha/beta fold hydrolase n=1 Tax=Bacillus cereus group TaxID=86661 RepID=UPI000B4B273A|nr:MULTISPECIES: alpha/beta hydrolase [Bacillus cereus group]MBE7141351.1 alpha/beta hydrolase [Bacillus paranthracis]MDA1502797.1 alpha/beta hydrolase [Bacillus cereus group sp. TH43LC]MDA1787322.1 alpha/beta hydrolase [Bacillus cereus group sp. BY5-1LC]MDA1866089.1 alpha/beta hydrolase [Bacillus cereus group sp. BY128LC]MED1613205.1 alpha/beta hydrolase [Bacillus paranthracis]
MANLIETGEYINIRGKKLYVETHGNPKNKPVLYLHGGPGESCYDFSFHQAERLKNSLYVIMIDQRGVCRSEEITEDEAFGLNDLIEDCEELRKSLQIEKWSIIGHSFGGYVALLYASIYPSSIEKIIFEGPTFDFALTSKALLQKTADLLKKYGKEEVAKACLVYLSSNASSEELLDAYIRLSDELEENRMEIYNYKEDVTDESLYSDEEWEVFSNRSKIHFDRLKLEGAFHTSLLRKIKDVQNPMLLIVGKHDVVTCEKQIEIFNKDARNGKYIVFEESGHSPHYEEADRFAETVIHFLK